MNAPEYRHDAPQPWAAMPISELIDRLQSIAVLHEPYTSLGAQWCSHCSQPWECTTHQLATGAAPAPPTEG